MPPVFTSTHVLTQLATMAVAEIPGVPVFGRFNNWFTAKRTFSNIVKLKWPQVRVNLSTNEHQRYSLRQVITKISYQTHILHNIQRDSIRESHEIDSDLLTPPWPRGWGGHTLLFRSGPASVRSPPTPTHETCLLSAIGDLKWSLAPFFLLTVSSIFDQHVLRFELLGCHTSRLANLGHL